MQKKFVFLSLLIALQVNFFTQTIYPVRDKSLDDFFKQLFSSQPKSPGPTRPRPGAARPRPMAMPTHVSPDKASAAVESKDKETIESVRNKLSELRKGTNEIIKSTQDKKIFDGDMGQEFLPIIQGVKKEAPTPIQKAPEKPSPAKPDQAKEKQKQTPTISYAERNVIGLLELIGIILGEPPNLNFYSRALTGDNFKPVIEKIKHFLLQVSDMKDEVETLEAKLKTTISQKEKNRRKLLGVKTPKQRQAQQDVSKQIKNFLRELAKLTAELEKVLSDPEVKKSIAQLAKTSPDRDFYNRFSGMGPSSHGYDPSGYRGDGYYPRGMGYPHRYTDPHSQTPSTSTGDDKTEPSKDDKDRSLSRVVGKKKKKADDKKTDPEEEDEPKPPTPTDIISLTQDVKSEIEDITSVVQADAGLSDNVESDKRSGTKLALLNKFHEIATLQDKMQKIARAQKTPQGKKDIQTKEYQDAKRALDQTIVANHQALATLTSYGVVELDQDNTGHFYLLQENIRANPISLAQNRLQNSYRSIVAKMSPQAKYTFQNLDKTYKSSHAIALEEKINFHLAKLRTIEVDYGQSFLIADESNKITKTRRNLRAIAQQIQALKNMGLNISGDPLTRSMGIISDQQEMLLQIKENMQKKLSPGLHKTIFKSLMDKVSELNKSPVTNVKKAEKILGRELTRLKKVGVKLLGTNLEKIRSALQQPASKAQPEAQAPAEEQKPLIDYLEPFIKKTLFPGKDFDWKNITGENTKTKQTKVNIEKIENLNYLRTSMQYFATANGLDDCEKSIILANLVINGLGIKEPEVTAPAHGIEILEAILVYDAKITQDPQTNIIKIEIDEPQTANPVRGKLQEIIDDKLRVIDAPEKGISIKREVFFPDNLIVKYKIQDKEFIKFVDNTEKLIVLDSIDPPEVPAESKAEPIEPQTKFKITDQEITWRELEKEAEEEVIEEEEEPRSKAAEEEEPLVVVGEEEATKSE